MEKAMLVFGAGTRTCIRKHVRLMCPSVIRDIVLIMPQLSITEMHKVVPELLRRFTVTIAHNESWKTRNATILLQSNDFCTVKRRDRGRERRGDTL
jgi:hypothetical protein